MSTLYERLLLSGCLLCLLSCPDENKHGERSNFIQTQHGLWIIYRPYKTFCLDSGCNLFGWGDLWEPRKVSHFVGLSLFSAITRMFLLLSFTFFYSLHTKPGRAHSVCCHQMFYWGFAREQVSNYYLIDFCTLQSRKNNIRFMFSPPSF